MLVGLDPDIVDKPPVPEVTAAKVRAAVEAESAKLGNARLQREVTVS